MPSEHILRRRSALAWLGASLAGTMAVTPNAVCATLPAPASLADELARALHQGQPLVVMVSLEGCPFCRVARDSYLEPLARQEGVPVVQIDMRSSRTVRDFSNAAVSHDDLVRQWDVKVAPTVLFFGPHGQEVAQRLRGAYIADFYGAYLDQRVASARAQIKVP